MKSDNIEFNLIDNYLKLLNNLSPANKLELISKLSDSLKTSKIPSDKNDISKLFGAFISSRIADEIIADIKSSRNFNRRTEGL